MFCSWRKSPSAPCSCAFILHSPVPEILNHLNHLGSGTLILRQRGLSVSQQTQFGKSIASQQSRNILQDRISGLQTDLTGSENCYLLIDATNNHPMLAMGEPGKPIDLSIRLNHHSWQSPEIKTLLAQCHATPLHCEESRRLGAGAWLDEWENISTRTNDDDLIRVASLTVQECEWLEVAVQTPNHRNSINFHPTFIDTEGSVLRIADRHCRHVIYADVDSPNFRIERVSKNQIRVSNTVQKH